MSNSDGARRESLSDSEATLRQVRGMLSDLTEAEDGAAVVGMADRYDEAPPGLAELVKVLVATYSEIMEVIEQLRQSRGLLEKASIDRLAVVSSRTEVAATGALDGIDRALNLVDELDTRDGTDADAPGEVADALRQELHTLMDLLRFQDTASQQLGYASSVLFDVEQRMVQLSQPFDTGIGLAGTDIERVEPVMERHVRHAVADAIFTAPEAG